MAYWLMKTEPGDYSWDELVADGQTQWTGVRNHQAANNMRAMKVGEKVLFYRSIVSPAVLGIMSVSRAAYPDPTDPDRWVLVDVTPVSKLPSEVSLKAIKADARLDGLALVRQSRLSVMPVSDEHWRVICDMAGLVD